MDSSKKYRIPDHIVRNSESNLNEADIAEIERIFFIADLYSYDASRTEKNWETLSSQLKTPMTVSKRPIRFAMFRWAAAAIVVLTLGLGIWQYRESQNPGYTALYTATTTKAIQSLPDGSTIQLNTGTTLEVKAMNAHKRVLELKSGEVFLSVQHSDIPFRVITEKGIITVLGTEFNISANKGETFSLFLKSGSIQFETGHKTIRMQAGDLLQEVSKGKYTLGKIEHNSPYAWVSGKLSFENTSLYEVIQGLENLYKVKFVFDNKLKEDKVTISFENLSAQQAADLLSKTINSKVLVK